MDIDDIKFTAVLIAAILGIIMLLLSIDMGSVSGAIMGIMFPVLVAFAFIFGSTVVAAMFGATPDGPTRTTHDLRALATATAVSGEGGGNVLIASATVDEKAVYRFYQEDATGGITLRTVDASSVVLYEDGRSEVVDVDGGWSSGSRVELHVPAGSIAEGVDLALPTN